ESRIVRRDRDREVVQWLGRREQGEGVGEELPPEPDQVRQAESVILIDLLLADLITDSTRSWAPEAGRDSRPVPISDACPTDKRSARGAPGGMGDVVSRAVQRPIGGQGADHQRAPGQGSSDARKGGWPTFRDLLVTLIGQDTSKPFTCNQIFAGRN